MASVFDGVVGAELLRSKLDAISRELKHLLVRSAFSTLMRETRDCSIVVLGPDGEAVNEGLAHGFFVRSVLERFEPGEGDIFICNHPFQCGVQHTNDLAVAMPVFAAGRRAGFVCSIAHKSDVGGAVVGSASSTSTELLQEGLLIPILRAGNGDDLSEHVIAIIEANTRDPELFLGDMRAQIGVTKVGVERLRELVEKTGLDAFRAGCQRIIDQTERQVRAAIAKLPDGAATCVGYIDSDGVHLDEPVRYEVTITIDGGRIIFDTTNSDDQRGGPINYSRTMTERAIRWAVLTLIDDGKSVPENDGLHKVIEVIFRPGSVLAARFPAPVGASTIVMHTFHDILMDGLSELAPERGISSGGGSGTMAVLYHRSAEGGAGTANSRAMQYEVIGSANGAIEGQDGCSGVLPHKANFNVTPIEVLEAQFPVRIRRFELLPDSAGPGKQRGGLGFRREYEFLSPVMVNRRADREQVLGHTIGGGMPGALGRQWIERDGTRDRVRMAGQYRLPAGAVLCIETGGGGGCGNPFDRDIQAVAADVRDGYVSPAQAAEHYGVVLRADGRVDTEATGRLRKAARETGCGDATGAPFRGDTADD
jgi:N-methylhydantoinase B